MQGSVQGGCEEKTEGIWGRVVEFKQFPHGQLASLGPISEWLAFSMLARLI